MHYNKFSILYSVAEIPINKNGDRSLASWFSAYESRPKVGLHKHFFRSLDSFCKDLQSETCGPATMIPRITTTRWSWMIYAYN